MTMARQRDDEEGRGRSRDGADTVREAQERREGRTMHISGWVATKLTMWPVRHGG